MTKPYIQVLVLSTAHIMFAHIHHECLYPQMHLSATFVSQDRAPLALMAPFWWHAGGVVCQNVNRAARTSVLAGWFVSERLLLGSDSAAPDGEGTRIGWLHEPCLDFFCVYEPYLRPFFCTNAIFVLFGARLHQSAPFPRQA